MKDLKGTKTEKNLPNCGTSFYTEAKSTIRNGTFRTPPTVKAMSGKTCTNAWQRKHVRKDLPK